MSFRPTVRGNETHCSFSFDSNDDLVQQISLRLLDEGKTGDFGSSLDLASSAINSSDSKRVVTSRDQSWRVVEISLDSCGAPAR